MEKRLVFVAAVVALVGGCAGGHLYGYSRTYEPLSDEEAFAERAVPLSYEELKRDAHGFSEYTESLVSFWGTVVQVEGAAGQGEQVSVSLDQRYHQPRHQCASSSEDSCRVTISRRVGGPFTASLTVQPGHRAGRDRISPGSLLRIYGHVESGLDSRGGLKFRVVYYRLFPGGTYVLAGRTDRMRR